MSFVSDKPIQREFTNQGQAVLRNEHRYFVERDADNWKLVEPSDRFVPAQELGQKFGLWKDKEITEGHLWWKETVRPLNAQIEPDEVVPMGQVLRMPHDSPVPGSIYPNFAYQDYYHLESKNTELKITPDGAILHTDWNTVGRYCRHAHSAENNPYLIA